MKKARHTAHRPNKAATSKTWLQFSYGGFTFETQGITRELIDGIECERWKLAVLVPLPNGLLKRNDCTVRLIDQGDQIRALDAIVGMSRVEQLAAKIYEQLDAAAKEVYHA